MATFARLGFGRNDNHRRVSALGQLLADEGQKPANCFYVNGRVEEGIQLSLDHPVTLRRGNYHPALVLGERHFVMRDAIGDRGCLYQIKEGKGVVRRASLGEMKISDDHSFPLLRRLEGEPATLLVHVGFGLPENIRLNAGVKSVWSGVRGGKLVMADVEEALVEMKKEDSLLIFYPDGRVAEVHHDSFTNLARTGGKMQSVVAEDALDYRLELISSFLQEKGWYKADRHAGFELAAMLRLTKGRRDLQKEVIRFIENLKTAFQPEPRFDLKGALRFVGDATPYWWLADDGSVDDVDAGPTPQQINRRNGELHGMISSAIEGLYDWENVAQAIKRAAEEGLLGRKVQQRFITNCPPGMSEEVGKLPTVEWKQEAKPSPLGRGDEPLTAAERAKEEAARAVRRADRHKNQPEKGKAGSGGGKNGQNNGGKKGKKK